MNTYQGLKLQEEKVLSSQGSGFMDRVYLWSKKKELERREDEKRKKGQSDKERPLADLAGILFHPVNYFKHIYNRPMLENFALGMLWGGIGTMLGLFWQGLLEQKGLLQYPIPFATGTKEGSLIMLFVFVVPILIAAEILISTMIWSLSLLLVGGLKKEWGRVFQVVCHTQAAHLTGIIPVIGPWIGMFWKIIIQVIGIKNSMGISYGRTILAMILPFFLLLGILVALVAITSGLILSGLV